MTHDHDIRSQGIAQSWDMARSIWSTLETAEGDCRGEDAPHVLYGPASYALSCAAMAFREGLAVMLEGVPVKDEVEEWEPWAKKIAQEQEALTARVKASIPPREDYALAKEIEALLGDRRSKDLVGDADSAVVMAQIIWKVRRLVELTLTVGRYSHGQ